jgi:hypothetical protein
MDLGLLAERRTGIQHLKAIAIEAAGGMPIKLVRLAGRREEDATRSRVFVRILLQQTGLFR